MSLANLEYDNFFVLHNALKIVKDSELDVLLTIDLAKDEKGAYFLPSSDAHIKSLNININEILDRCSTIGVLNLILDNSNFSLRFDNLFKKIKNLKQQKCNTCRFETLRTAWFDFGILVNTMHSILINEVNLKTSECSENVLNETGFSEYVKYLLVHSAELMKITAISESKIKDSTKKLH